MVSLNRIVYVDLNGRIATVNPDGSEQKVLTSDHRVFQFPSWSPKKNQIAAVGSDDNGDGLYLISEQQQDSSTHSELYISQNQLPFYQYWSPDGEMVSFLTTHPQGFGLRIAYLNGKNFLLTIGQPLFWSWTNVPDQLFIHSGFTEADSRLTFIGTKGDGWGENIAQPGYFQVPGISQDGRYWAFAAIDAFGSRYLVVENNDTDDRQQVEQQGMLALGWSPAHPILAFIGADSKEQRPFGPLTLINAPRKETRIVVEKNIIAFFWSPDGQKIAYLALPEVQSIQNSSYDDGTYQSTQTMYTNGVVPYTLKMPHEDSLLYLDLYVYDLKRNESRFLTTVAPPTTFLNQYLPFFDQFSLSHRLWSPDSQQLIMPSLEGETAVLRMIPINGRSSTEVAEGLMPSWSHF